MCPLFCAKKVEVDAEITIKIVCIQSNIWSSTEKKLKGNRKKKYYKKEKYSWYCSLVVSQIYSGVVVQQDEE